MVPGGVIVQGGVMVPCIWCDGTSTGGAELSTGRMDPRVWSGHDFAGFWRVGSALRNF